jgi:hypothetical protein
MPFRRMAFQAPLLLPSPRCQGNAVIFPDNGQGHSIDAPVAF